MKKFDPISLSFFFCFVFFSFSSSSSYFNFSIPSFIIKRTSVFYLVAFRSEVRQSFFRITSPFYPRHCRELCRLYLLSEKPWPGLLVFTWATENFSDKILDYQHNKQRFSPKGRLVKYNSTGSVSNLPWHLTRWYNKTEKHNCTNLSLSLL